MGQVSAGMDASEEHTKPRIVVYFTSLPTTQKIRSDCLRLRGLLDALKVKLGIEFEECDLSQTPDRRLEMLNGAEGHTQLPQLHVDARFIGSCDEVQEMQDFGELEPVLTGTAPQQPEEEDR